MTHLMKRRITLAMLLTLLTTTWAIKAQDAVPFVAASEIDSACSVSEEPMSVETTSMTEASDSTSVDDSRPSPTHTLPTYEPPKAPDLNFIKSRTNHISIIIKNNGCLIKYKTIIIRKKKYCNQNTENNNSS